MRRKLSALLITTFLATSPLSTALAAETQDLKTAAGITPDSIIYPVERAVENIQLALTSDDVKEAELLTENAEERLAETQVMDEEGKTEVAENTAKEYTETIQKAIELLQNVVDDINKEDSVATTEEVQATATTTPTVTPTPTQDEQKQEEKNKVLEELLRKNEELQKKSVDVLAALLEKLPEDAKESITAVIVKQVMHTEAVRNFVTTKKEYNDGRKDVREAVNTLKKAEKSGEQAQIDAAKEALKKANEDLSVLLTAKNEAWNNKKEIKSLIEAKLAELNASVDDDKEEVEDEAEASELEKEEALDNEDNSIKDTLKLVAKKVEKELESKIKSEEKNLEMKKKIEEKKLENQTKVEEKKAEIQKKVEEKKIENQSKIEEKRNEAQKKVEEKKDKK